MNQQEVNLLLQKYQSGTATEQEKALLESWYLSYEEPAAETLSMEERVAAVDKVWANLQDGFPAVKRLNLWPRIAVAALVVIALSIGFYFVNTGSRQLESDRIAHTKQDIAPGSNKAVLSLGNGKTVDLSSQQSGITIHTGKLAYNDGTAINAAAGRMLSLTTPKGGIYRLILPDGTSVWLNASSSLSFPATFEGAATREVSLKGEAYFEVAKNKSVPFRVTAAGQLVEVLGTHFNISSYADDPVAKTTLLEGSIRTGGLILKPGEQAIVKDGRAKAEQANIEETIGWKNGYFIFENESITSIMKKISRWYNVDVVYEGEIPSDNFGGRVSRSGYVSEILKTLELTGKVHFKVEGRRITVIK